MDEQSLEQTAQALVEGHRGVLAADERVATLSRRFASLGIPSTPEMRRDYRLMLLTTPELARFISGVILYDETFRQTDPRGEPIVRLAQRVDVIPGIKVDRGPRPLAGSMDEMITEGLDGLRERLEEYAKMGARFAKWRAVFHIDDALPSEVCVEANAEALARYAALCQEQGLVPIVEPEVLMNGSHGIDRTEVVTEDVLHRVFEALRRHHVLLEGMLLKPNMVVAGHDFPRPVLAAEVAAATLRVLRRVVPVAVPGIVFLSGGQGDQEATRNLQALNASPQRGPWPLSFSFGRALQDAPMRAWRGHPTGVEAGQEALYHRARCNSAAAAGAYDPGMEEQGPSTSPMVH